MENSGSTSYSIAEIGQLLSRINCSDETDQIRASQEIVALGPKGLEAWFSAIEKPHRQDTRIFRWLKCLIYQCVLFGIAWLQWGPDLIMVPLLTLLAVMGWINALFYGAAPPVQGKIANSRLLAQVLTELQDKQYVGILVERGLESSVDTIIRNASRSALEVMLSHLQYSDRHLLNDTQSLILCSQLQQEAYEDVNWLLIILKAFEHIGGAREIPVVEKLAQLDSTNSHSMVIRQAAQTCLPFLYQNAENSKDSVVLLRASACTAQPDTLLRPVEGTASASPEELLRPDLKGRT